MFNPSTLKRGELNKIINEEIAKCAAECGKKLILVTTWATTDKGYQHIDEMGLFDLEETSIGYLKRYIKKRSLVTVTAHYGFCTAY